MGGILALMLGWLRSFLGLGAVGWLVGWLPLFFVGALLLQSYNFLVDLWHELFLVLHTIQQDALNNAASGTNYGGLQIVGIGAYLAHHLRLVESLSWVVNIVLARTALKVIPFIGVAFQR